MMLKWLRMRQDRGVYRLQSVRLGPDLVTNGVRLVRGRGVAKHCIPPYQFGLIHFIFVIHYIHPHQGRLPSKEVVTGYDTDALIGEGRELLGEVLS